MSDIYSIPVDTIDGNPATLEGFRGKVLLIVNVASKCGFTPQYDGLEKLYQELKGRGFEILGFPCNQFGGQEPGSEEEIKSFCRLNYGVSFPLFSKVEVNGENAHQLYKHLKKSCPGILGTEGIKWNFTKFLLDRQGRVLKRFAPTASPASLQAEIEAIL
ncbi:MAG: glutathione peroxidase [Deltaproteobacteria bacterium]|nr:glutathione peroxidase [Deltaproteobacteria bacterium]